MNGWQPCPSWSNSARTTPWHLMSPECSRTPAGGELKDARLIVDIQQLQICASRLAREPGWPIDDPPVPPGRDELLDPAPWRDEKLDTDGAQLTSISN